jgi:hypothetical protein
MSRRRRHAHAYSRDKRLRARRRLFQETINDAAATMCVCAVLLAGSWRAKPLPAALDFIPLGGGFNDAQAAMLASWIRYVSP